MFHGIAFKLGAMGVVFAGVFAAANPKPSIADISMLVVLIAGITVYTVAQIRDYRPNKRLREDNAELRKICDDQLERINTNEGKIASLEQSRDFDTAMAVVVREVASARAETATEHRELLDEYQHHTKVEVEAWGSLQRELGALTSAIQAWATTIAKEV